MESILMTAGYEYECARNTTRSCLFTGEISLTDCRVGEVGRDEDSKRVADGLFTTWGASQKSHLPTVRCTG